MTLLAAAYPQAGIRVLLGNAPHILLKVPKGERNTEFVLEILKKYNAFRSVPGKGSDNT